MPQLPALILFLVMLFLPCLFAGANHFYREDPYEDFVEPQFVRETIVGMPWHEVDDPSWIRIERQRKSA